MSHCCTSVSTVDNVPKQYRCPVNGKEYKNVSPTTIIHNIAKPWQWQVVEQGYYYCDDPDCNVVYFGEDNSVINAVDLRDYPDEENHSSDPTLCFCFGVKRSDYYADPHIKEYIVQKTKNKQCACDIRNPSGKCCLKNFPER